MSGAERSLLRLFGDLPQKAWLKRTSLRLSGAIAFCGSVCYYFDNGKKWSPEGTERKKS